MFGTNYIMLLLDYVCLMEEMHETNMLEYWSWMTSEVRLVNFLVQVRQVRQVSKLGKLGKLGICHFFSSYIYVSSCNC